MKVIDNFLSDNVADQIENSIIQDNFPWYYTGKGVYNSNVYFFSHSLLNNGKKSDYADEILLPLVSKMDGKKLLRAKINCYTKTENYTHYPYHYDNDEDKDIKVAIYYVNTNNGYTEVKDKGKTTVDQRNFINVITKSGGLAGVARDVTDAKKILDIV